MDTIISSIIMPHNIRLKCPLMVLGVTTTTTINIVITVAIGTHYRSGQQSENASEDLIGTGTLVLECRTQPADLTAGKTSALGEWHSKFGEAVSCYSLQCLD
jgi:hypothetical protein